MDGMDGIYKEKTNTYSVLYCIFPPELAKSATKTVLAIPGQRTWRYQDFYQDKEIRNTNGLKALLSVFKISVYLTKLVQNVVPLEGALFIQNHTVL